jgi:predicted DNA-binding WGR domain protein
MTTITFTLELFNQLVGSICMLTSISFVVGALTSLVVGYIGMTVAGYSNARVTTNAKVDMDIIGDLDDEDWESLLCHRPSKFWRGITVGKKLFVHYGKVGNKGTYQQKTFESEEEANKQLLNDVAQRHTMGYITNMERR